MKDYKSLLPGVPSWRAVRDLELNISPFWPLIVVLALVETSYGKTTAYEYPASLAAASLYTCSLLLYLTNRFLSAGAEQRLDRIEEYELVPRRGSTSIGAEPATDGQLNARPPRVRAWYLMVGCTTLLVLRVDLFRRIQADAQCTARSYEVFIPVFLAVYDSIWQKSFVLEDQASMNDTMYDAMGLFLVKRLQTPRWRYIPSALLVVTGLYTLTGLWATQTTTVICPIASGRIAWVPMLQKMALVLDVSLAISIDLLISSSQPAAPVSKPISYVCFFTANIWTLLPLVLSPKSTIFQLWSLVTDGPYLSTTFLSIAWQALLFSISASILLSVAIKYGMLLTTMVATSFLTIAPMTHQLWSTNSPYPTLPFKTTLWSILAGFVGLWWFLWVRASTGHLNSSPPSPRRGLLLILLALSLTPSLFKHARVHFHPIELLMYDAKQSHEQYLQFATQSKTLVDAVRLYRERHKIDPPPGFDSWWKFAQGRSVLITDDFDQIHTDLLPFWTIPPHELRMRIQALTVDPSQQIAAIRIQKGNTTIDQNVGFEQRRMLQGIADMIDTFVEYLPDMELAINLMDLPRVAVSHDTVGVDSVRAVEHRVDESHSGSVAKIEQWTPAELQSHRPAFKDLSSQNTFSILSSIACAGRTAARWQHHVLAQPYLCSECARPHSIGHFVSNWSLAMNPCHQPDIAQLHGFYSSPSEALVTHELSPIFSASKPHGFNDILYPSAWSYMDTIAYAPVKPSGVLGTPAYVPGLPDPDFDNKLNVLYWRGKTSEGTSLGNGVWRGMVRQRLVHMANNLTTTHHDHVTILLPDPTADGKYTYQTYSAADFVKLGLVVNAHFVDGITHSVLNDLADQREEFMTVKSTDFQENRMFRYVFDIDGAGASGQFLPYLRSRSLPFRTGIFREWYESRITPWRHFVPQDLRLHGLWSTLAFFGGVVGKIGDREIQWQAHTREGKLIADEGRKWAGRVLTKADMEVYMFRLLLEWGRLFDDRRDSLGFRLEDPGIAR